MYDILVDVPSASGWPNLVAKDRQKAIDDAVVTEMSAQRVVGAAVGVIQSGRITYVQAYGFADERRRIKTTLNTVFNWASNCKPLAAVAAMQLTETGTFSEFDATRQYLAASISPWQGIDVRHLLSHQSGLPHYNDAVTPSPSPAPVNEQLTNPIAALDRFNQSTLLFAPGTAEHYSSYAYILLSAVVQVAGRAPFFDQIRERIARPLRMTSLQPDFAREWQPFWATGYVEFQDVITPTADEARAWVHGGGGYKSNIKDFTKWAHGLLTERLLTHATQDRMWTPQTLNNRTTTTRCLGFTVDGSGNSLRISHGGKQDEVTTRMALYPNRGDGVVVMTNCNFADVGNISQAVFGAL